MQPERNDEACRILKLIDLVSAVKELHRLGSQELNKLLRDADDDAIQWTSSDGSSKQIDIETLARYLPLNLISKLLESEGDEELFRYLLSGIKLLHTLCDLAPRNSKLDQVLLEDMTVSEQMFDLIFFMIMVLCKFRQDSQLFLLHSALLACSLYLLTAFVSSQWHELSQVLLAHPMVDRPMFGAFVAVHRNIQFVQLRLSAQYTDISKQSNLAEVNRLCQHCEASLQFLQSLSQQKLFRERLIRNKDLCEEGGILMLAHDIMKLPFFEEPYLMAVVSRLKSKVLSILLHLCEVESVSFLDVVASNPRVLNLAKSTIFQVLELLKTMFHGDGFAAFSDKTYPRGLLQLNAMQLTEILSDDSNFRSYITLNFTEVLTTIFLQPNAEFSSNWCSSESWPSEDDATLDFDPLTAAGWVLGVSTSSDVPESTFNACRVPRTSYAFQRTSLLVKIVANLTCFVPDICKEEMGLFLNTFLQCLRKEFSTLPLGVSNDIRAERVDIITQNLHALLGHAESLIPAFLNQDDVQLFRLFTVQLEPLISQEININNQEINIDQATENNNEGQESQDALVIEGNQNEDKNEDKTDNIPLEDMNTLNLNTNEGPSNETPMQDQRTSIVEAVPATGVHEGEGDALNIETHGLDSNSTITQQVQSDEKQVKKRKRNIMNYVQISMMEQALQNEPEMQRKAALVQSWAEKISLHGSEISSSQLKNWLNNRKAKLARVAAAKDVSATSGGDNASFTDKQGGSGTEPESADEFLDPGSSAAQTGQSKSGGSSVKHKPGQLVVLTDIQGEEIGKGCVHQAHGVWSGTNLDESKLCVVDVTYLKVDKWTNLPHPCDATGASFGHAEQINGVKRVLWDSAKLVLQRLA
ncbi:nodulin homeobox-like [Rutidosis leptorrhynchoides]|uniref:nodulin homeobox-like n=1 Tax=Rutidosis leptorrhynchoides TaxID=125765 RepID=UPI003A995527